MVLAEEEVEEKVLAEEVLAEEAVEEDKEKAKKLLILSKYLFTKLWLSTIL
jgi:hypothetical protein